MSSGEEDDEVEDIQKPKKAGQNKDERKKSVSAEAYGDWNKKGNFKPKIIKKSAEN